MSVDPARTLAEHVITTTFDTLPEHAVVSAKRDILDTLGAALGGSGAPGIATLAGLVRRWGGAAEARVLLLGDRVPAPQAALLNAAMGHALDFDDTLDHGGSIHPGVSTLMASLAAAELRAGTSGRDVITAVALGLDVSCRLALAATVDRGWHRTSAIGIFGATAAAGKVLGLTVEQLHHAFGIAYSQAAGNRQCIVDAALTKRLQAGQAASSAILAVLLAQEGFSGARDVFAGRFGFFPMYQPDSYDLGPITAELGTTFRGAELSFKPYPCGRPTHAIIDAALALYQQLDLDTAGDDTDIAEVTVVTDTHTYATQFAPGTHARRPTQVVEAQFSVPYLIATALTLGRVGIGDVAQVEHPAVLALAERLQGEARTDAPTGWARLTVRCTDGRRAARETTTPSGSPANPLTEAQLKAKFRDCAAHAVRAIPADVVDQALHRVWHLEEVADATEMLGLFQPGG
jgi:2-methylcitrate dehydratase PrpD